MLKVRSYDGIKELSAVPVPDRFNGRDELKDARAMAIAAANVTPRPTLVTIAKTEGGKAIESYYHNGTEVVRYVKPSRRKG